jgi:hypothetical protein
MDELLDQHAELLPTREALSDINVKPVTAVNLAFAINIGDGNALAIADQFAGHHK